MSSLRNRALAIAAAGFATVTAPRPSWAWETAEHIHFGIQIAEPFEQRLGYRLPVIVAWPDPERPGPRTFGHYVAAPDFARGLRFFLDRDPIVGPVACAALWAPDGVVDGADLQDHMHDMVINDQPASIDNIGYADCVDTWRANNSHFGEFAVTHYLYHHALALEAARRYRSNRAPACRAAAYTLEGWAQHYLTDTSALGHAWTPPGTYDGTTYDWQTSTSPERMRIHDHLNAAGGRFAEDAFDLGWVWGDHSEAHTDDGQSIPEREGDAQRALSLRITRIGLGQVVSVAECGGLATAADVFTPRLDAGDTRRIYASDSSMCDAMWGHQILWWAPDSYTYFGLDLPVVRDAVARCQADAGDLSSEIAGSALAGFYFQDAFYHANTDDGIINPAIDGRAELDLEALDCYGDTAPEPLDAPDQRDMCGHVLCEAPPRVDGSCAPPRHLAGGCCYEEPALVDGAGEISMTSWGTGPTTTEVALLGTGATVGGTAEFLWLRERVPPFAPDDFAPLTTGALAALDGSDTFVSECGDVGAVSVFEARLRLPRTTAFADTSVYLSIHDLDEGVEVTVDDRLVRYVRRGEVVDLETDTPHGLTLALFDAALAPADGDAYRVRLIHLNDCGDGRPLIVTVQTSADASPDGFDITERAKASGCSTGGAPSTGGLVALAGLLYWLRRRQRTRRTS